MEKIFLFEGYKFLLKVRFNTRVERTPDGQREHTLCISNLGAAKYSREYKLNAKYDLQGQIGNIETDAKAWVTKRSNLSSDEMMFELLGFTK